MKEIYSMALTKEVNFYSKFTLANSIAKRKKEGSEMKCK